MLPKCHAAVGTEQLLGSELSSFSKPCTPAKFSGEHVHSKGEDWLLAQMFSHEDDSRSMRGPCLERLLACQQIL